jgi:hypothetical protein
VCKLCANDDQRTALASSILTKSDCIRLLTCELQISRREQVEGALDLPAALGAVESELSSVAAFSDTILRDISTALLNAVDFPLSIAALTDPGNPGQSNLCLGLATAALGTTLMPSHIDGDILTVTYYEEPFLEVLEPTTQEWVLVRVCEGLLLINVGEKLQQASHGRLKATLHRVKQCPAEIDLVIQACESL